MPHRLKMVSRSSSVVTALSLHTKMYSSGAAASAVGRSPIISSRILRFAAFCASRSASISASPLHAGALDVVPSRCPHVAHTYGRIAQIRATQTLTACAHSNTQTLTACAHSNAQMSVTAMQASSY